ncbi:MAG: DNA mismatch repair protein MutS [Bacillota bacterium]
MGYTPMMQQYLQIKQNYQDAILFFRLGDFYEMFFEDALLASRELEITLTGRDGGREERVPMCGVPYHAAGAYLSRLVQKGHRVAICEQVEDPSEARGIVRREVVRVVSPGTVFEEQSLDDKQYNLLVALAFKGQACGLAFVDITTGLCRTTEFTGEGARAALFDELSRLEPAEIVVARSELTTTMATWLAQLAPSVITPAEDESFEQGRAGKVLERQFGLPDINPNLRELPLAYLATGGLIGYLHETQKSRVAQVTRVEVYSSGQYMMMDGITRRNLEINKSIREGDRSGTLFSVLNLTVTAMGGRMLRNWLEQPLIDLRRIKERQEVVADLAGNLLLRMEIRELLKKVYDLDRLAGRIGHGNAGARDLVALRQSLQVLPEITASMDTIATSLGARVRDSINPLHGIRQLLEGALVDDPPPSLREGGLIREGYDAEVDRLRKAARDGKSWLAELESEHRRKTGIKSLKIGYNKVFGYYIEVTRANLPMVPPDYIRRQTLANAERYITPELKEYEEAILGAVDRLMQLEYQLFLQIREQVAENILELQGTARAVACIDVLCALAEAAVKFNYVRPRVTDRQVIKISSGRHPVVERTLGEGKFVPNDTLIDRGNFLVLLTGPNMAGKSTYMRQVALIVLMAQMGSFVPAGEAEIGIVDRIFTRVGAADNLAGGQSTFMVEMSECRLIVEGATDRSLVIMDEVGRGTSTYDGISIAHAVVEYIRARIKARTLFSTHYHELTELEQLAGIVNYTVKIQEEGDNIVFLHRVAPGKADRSYGIHVARLAGLPGEIIARAEEILQNLQKNNNGAGEQKQVSSRQREEGTLGEEDKHSVLSQLSRLDINSLSPLEALNIIAGWQEMLARQPGLKCRERVGG